MRSLLFFAVVSVIAGVLMLFCAPGVQAQQPRDGAMHSLILDNGQPFPNFHTLTLDASSATSSGGFSLPNPATTSGSFITTASSGGQTITAGGLTIDGGLNVSGLTTANTGLSVTSGGATITGGLTVTGLTTLNTALEVTGLATLNTGLAVTGLATLNTGLSVTGGINNNNGGMTLVGPMTGVTTITASGLFTSTVTAGNTAFTTTGNIQTTGSTTTITSGGSISSAGTMTSGNTFTVTTGGASITGGLTLSPELTVPNGGTGAVTLTGYVKGNGTSAFTASPTIPNTDITGLGTMSVQNASSVAITGGTIDGTTIGGSAAAAGTFSTVTLYSTACPLVANASAGTAGQVLTSAGSSATPTWSENVLGTYGGNFTGMVSSQATILCPNGDGPAGSTQGGIVITRSGTLKNLYMATSASPNVASGVVLAVWLAHAGTNAITSLTATVQNAATSANDVTHTVSVVAGDVVTVVVQTAAGINASCSIAAWGFEFTSP